MARQQTLVIVYDGECPLCRNLVLFYQIKQKGVQLIDARSESSHLVLDEIIKRDLDLDRGMVVKHGTDFYHGADAVWFLGRYANQNRGFFQRICWFVGQARWFCRFAYPFLRLARNLLLRIKGIRPIGKS